METGFRGTEVALRPRRGSRGSRLTSHTMLGTCVHQKVDVLSIAAIGSLSVLGAAVEPLNAASRNKKPETPPDYYDKLGVTKIINAAGTYTELTSAVMPPPVREAVAQAALHPVVLADLQQKAGAYIAQKLQTEGCCISCGASSALTLATAASLMAANNCNITDIPKLIGTPQNGRCDCASRGEGETIGQRYWRCLRVSRNDRKNSASGSTKLAGPSIQVFLGRPSEAWLPSSPNRQASWLSSST